MAYKLYLKELSSYEKKLKQARRDRRRAKHSPAPVLEIPTTEQLEGIFNATSVNVNTHLGSILKAHYPETLPLMGASIVETAKHFSDAGKLETMREAVRQCEEEIEALVGAFLLSFVDEPISKETT